MPTLPRDHPSQAEIICHADELMIGDRILVELPDTWAEIVDLGLFPACAGGGAFIDVRASFARRCAVWFSSGDHLRVRPGPAHNADRYARLSAQAEARHPAAS